MPTSCLLCDYFYDAQCHAAQCPIRQTIFARVEGGGDMNQQGEIIGHGPLWACDQYATAQHSYYDCQVCRANYEAWLAEIRRQYVNQ